MKYYLGKMEQIVKKILKSNRTQEELNHFLHSLAWTRLGEDEITAVRNAGITREELKRGCNWLCEIPCYEAIKGLREILGYQLDLHDVWQHRPVSFNKRGWISVAASYIDCHENHAEGRYYYNKKEAERLQECTGIESLCETDIARITLDKTCIEFPNIAQLLKKLKDEPEEVQKRGIELSFNVAGRIYYIGRIKTCFGGRISPEMATFRRPGSTEIDCGTVKSRVSLTKRAYTNYDELVYQDFRYDGENPIYPRIGELILEHIKKDCGGIFMGGDSTFSQYDYFQSRGTFDERGWKHDCDNLCQFEINLKKKFK